MSIMKRTTVALTILVYSFFVLGCSGSDEGVIKARKAQEARVTNIALERFEVFIDKLNENPKYAQITANPNFKALILPYFKNIVRFEKYSGATDSEINTYYYKQKRMMNAAAENWVREWITEEIVRKTEREREAQAKNRSREATQGTYTYQALGEKKGGGSITLSEEITDPTMKARGLKKGQTFVAE